MSIKSSSDFYQFECYCLESPVSCSILPTKNLKSTLLTEPQNQSQSQKSILEITLWDNKHQMQNYVVYDENFKNQEALNFQDKTLKKGDLKSHKFKIKKAYSSGSYFIILDEDNIVTVRKQWQIQQCFTEIKDIVVYQLHSTQFISSNDLQNHHEFDSSTNCVGNSTIFILHQDKSLAKVEKQKEQQDLSGLSQLIVLVIQQQVSGNKESDSKDNQKEQQKEVQYKSVKLNKNGKFTLSPNGRWAFIQNFIIPIQVTVPHLTKGFLEMEKSIQIRLNYISLDFIIQKIEKKIVSILYLDQVKTNEFLIIYLNNLLEICSCSFHYLFESSKVPKSNFIQGERIYSSKQEHTQNQNFMTLSFTISERKWSDMIIRLYDHSFWIYSLKELKLISQISLISLTDNPLSHNCQIVYQQKWIVWIFDRSNISLHKFDLIRIVEQRVLKPLIQVFNPVCEDLSKSHINTSKLLNLRLKILKLLKTYLQGKSQNNLHTHSQGRIQSPKTYNQKERAKSADFLSCLRLLSKEQNISILNDGVSYVTRYILSRCQTIHNLQNILSVNLTLKALEESLIKLLNKLILSKYQSHVQNGLDLLLKTFNFFNSQPQKQKSNINLMYEKIAESSRIQKLLQQQKKQKLWELAYMFSLKVQRSLK